MKVSDNEIPDINSSNTEEKRVQLALEIKRAEMDLEIKKTEYKERYGLNKHEKIDRYTTIGLLVVLSCIFVVSLYFTITKQ
jgi:hypothetical protein